MPSTERLLPDIEAVMRLAAKLAACPQVARYDEPDRSEAQDLANALKDLEAELLTVQQTIRDLQAATDCDAIVDALDELRVPLWHIVYHCVNTGYYGQDWFRAILELE